MDWFYSIVGFFTTGGPFMYPILVVFAFGAAIAIERYFTLTQVTARNQSMWGRLQPILTEGDFDKAREMTSEDDSAISQLLRMGLARQGAVRRREDIEIAMEESMMEIIPQLEKRTPYVALASNIATLLGLLGTRARCGIATAATACFSLVLARRHRTLRGVSALGVGCRLTTRTRLPFAAGIREIRVGILCLRGSRIRFPRVRLLGVTAGRVLLCQLTQTFANPRVVEQLLQGLRVVRAVTL